MFGIRIKDIKKRLKRSRRPVWSLGILAAVVVGSAVAGTFLSRHYVNEYVDYAPPRGDALPVWADKLPVTYDPDGSRRGEAMTALSQWNGGEVEVVLHRVFLCGDETRRLGRHSTEETMALLKAHREWNAAFDSVGRVTMEERVDDLSPQCRKTAYIAMDQAGRLSLFDGPPRKEKVIRTFFQLDVKSLESSMSKEKLKELAEGIRVKDRDEFNSVLSSFSEYALPGAAADVMKPVD